MADDEYVDLGSSDWGDCLDDADGESYESLYYYEPIKKSNHTNDDDDDDDDDDHNDQPIGCEFANPYHCDKCEEDYVDNQKRNYRLKKENERRAERKRAIDRDATTERRLSILKWLYKSEISRIIKSGEGFFVNSGPKVKLKNGHIVDILKWLFIEGVCPNRYVAGHIVTYYEESKEYPEKLMFLEVGDDECSRAEGYKNFVKSDGNDGIFRFEGEGILFIPNYRTRGAKDESTDRQKDIMKWLSNSKYAKPYKNSGGFYVAKGAMVKLKSGKALDILDWLISEGFGSCRIISEYNVKHVEESQKFKEALYFFKVVAERRG